MSFKGYLNSIFYKLKIEDSICIKFIKKISIFYFLLNLNLFFSGILILYTINLENFVKLFIYIFSFYFIFIYVIFIILIRFIFKSLIIKRLNIIRNELDGIKKGNFKNRIKINGYDEIDSVANLTNEIVNEFEKLYSLERRNAILDPLTNCRNRRALEVEFDGIKEKAKREKKSVSFLIFDIDDFKKINDKYGHYVGDCVLKILSKTVKNLIRKYDFLYRIGGEEFLILFYDLKKKDIDNILKRILKEIPYKIKKGCIEITDRDVTISGGFISKNYKDLSNLDLKNVIIEADKLLYKAKKNGKNQIEK